MGHNLSRSRAGAPLWLVGLIAVSVVWQVALAHGSYFTTDDHVFFAQAAEQPFGWHFLTEPIHDHFSPWHRLQDHVVASLTDQGWWLALAIAAAWAAVAILLFAALVRRLVGDHPAGIAVTVAFALSPVLVEHAQWWGLAAQFYPHLVFSLAALLGALAWSRSRRPLTLVLTLLAYALALCGFIKALLVAPLLVLVLYLRPQPGRGLVERLRPAWREDRLLWIGVAVLTVAYALIITGDRYYRFIEAAPAASVSLWVKYALAGWGEGVAPLTFAGTVPDALGAANLLVIAVANLALVALVVLTVRRRPAAVFTWLGVMVVVAGALVMSGGARLSTEGVERVAIDPRYNAEAAVAVLLGTALAACAAWPRPRAPRGGVAALWIGLAAVVAFAVDSGLRREREWVGKVHRAYFDTFARTLAEVPDAAVLDGTVPPRIVHPSIVPYNLYSAVLPLREPGVRVGGTDGRPAALDQSGRVVPVDLETTARLPSGCAPLRYDVDVPEGPYAVALSFARRDAQEPVDAQVVADSGVEGVHEVGGFPLLPVSTTPVRLRAGQSTLRTIVGAGATVSLAIDAAAGRPLCIDDVRLERFELVDLP